MVELANPRARDSWETALSDHGVICFSVSANESHPHAAAPDLAHALSGVATEALAHGSFGEDPAPEFAEFALVNPRFGDGHDRIAVIEEEGVAVGMAKEIEGRNGAARTRVDCRDGLGPAVDPDQGTIPLGGLFLNPRGIRFAVFPRPGKVTRSVNDPDELSLAAFPKSDPCHAQSGGPDEICPPFVMALALDPQILPLPQGRTATEDDMFGDRCGEAGERKQGRQNNQESHGGEDGARGQSEQGASGKVLHI